jgi:hypothetical protein
LTRQSGNGYRGKQDLGQGNQGEGTPNGHCEFLWAEDWDFDRLPIKTESAVELHPRKRLLAIDFAPVETKSEKNWAWAIG